MINDLWNAVAFPLAAFGLNMLYAVTAFAGFMAASSYLDYRLRTGKSSISDAYDKMCEHPIGAAIYHGARILGFCWLAASFVH